MTLDEWNSALDANLDVTSILLIVSDEPAIFGALEAKEHLASKPRTWQSGLLDRSSCLSDQRTSFERRGSGGSGRRPCAFGAEEPPLFLRLHPWDAALRRWANSHPDWLNRSSECKLHEATQPEGWKALTKPRRGRRRPQFADLASACKLIKISPKDAKPAAIVARRFKAPPCDSSGLLCPLTRRQACGTRPFDRSALVNGRTSIRRP